jgi:hypothetical protein
MHDSATIGGGSIQAHPSVLTWPTRAASWCGPSGTSASPTIQHIGLIVSTVRWGAPRGPDRPRAGGRGKATASTREVVFHERFFGFSRYWGLSPRACTCTSRPCFRAVPATPNSVEQRCAPTAGRTGAAVLNETVKVAQDDADSDRLDGQGAQVLTAAVDQAAGGGARPRRGWAALRRPVTQRGAGIRGVGVRRARPGRSSGTELRRSSRRR